VSGAELDDPLLTVAEVAGLLKLNPQTIRNWIDQGSLPAVRVGPRRVRIRRSDLERVLEQGYSRRGSSQAASAGPTAQEFWAGEAVTVAQAPPPTGSAPAPSDRSTDRG
jgi:excisionase family DNA binding protein